MFVSQEALVYALDHHDYYEYFTVFLQMFLGIADWATDINFVRFLWQYNLTSPTQQFFESIGASCGISTGFRTEAVIAGGMIIVAFVINVVVVYKIIRFESANRKFSEWWHQHLFVASGTCALLYVILQCCSNSTLSIVLFPLSWREIGTWKRFTFFFCSLDTRSSRDQTLYRKKWWIFNWSSWWLHEEVQALKKRAFWKTFGLFITLFADGWKMRDSQGVPGFVVYQLRKQKLNTKVTMDTFIRLTIVYII